jgi:hypothetical protein
MCGSIGAAGLLAGQPLDTGPSHFHPLILILIFIHLTYPIRLCLIRLPLFYRGWTMTVLWYAVEFDSESTVSISPV